MLSTVYAKRLSGILKKYLQIEENLAQPIFSYPDLFYPVFHNSRPIRRIQQIKSLKKSENWLWIEPRSLAQLSAT